MMSRKFNIPTVLICATLFTFFFYKHSLGLNLFIYELLIITGLLGTKQVPLTTRYGLTITGLFTLSAFATIITHSVFCYLVNFTLFFVFIGYAVYPQARSYATSAHLALYNFVNAQRRFFKEFRLPKWRGSSMLSAIWRVRIFIIPLFIILAFIGIYRMSNPVFNDIFSGFFEFLNKYFWRWLGDVNFAIIFTFILGLLVSNFVWLRVAIERIVKADETALETLVRKRLKARYMGSPTALKNEYRAAIFLLVTLNALILVLNITDIIWVWFGFKWEGQYLKQFVHEGTYLLIVSILISILLVLYYFRNNLNFYPQNTLLKKLSFAWLGQNALLAVSVGIRNFWYISYFSLAYKRIGVIIFLLLTLYGLYTVYIKVKQGKSSFYLFKQNTYAGLVVLTLASVINWDIIIAKYNFAHADKSYLHLNFMAELSNTALPYIDKPLEEVKKLKLSQEEEYSSFEISSSSLGRGSLYITPERYVEIIQSRKDNFKREYEQKTWLEWNFAEWNAYRNLTN